MPSLPNRPCRGFRCTALITAAYGYCEYCSAKRHKAIDARRKPSSERGYDARWRKARLAYLSVNPMCVACTREGKATLASVVDHVIPHRGDQVKFWDEANWQALCVAHHNAKTMKGM